MNKKFLVFLAGLVAAVLIGMLAFGGGVFSEDASGKLRAKSDVRSKVSKSVERFDSVAKKTSSKFKEFSPHYGFMKVAGERQFDNLVPVMEVFPELDDMEQYRAHWIEDCMNSQELADAFNGGVLYTYDECSDQFDQMMTPSDGMMPSSHGSLCSPPGSTKNVTHTMVINGEAMEAEMTCTCSGSGNTATWNCV